MTPDDARNGMKLGKDYVLLMERMQFWVLVPGVMWNVLEDI